MCSLASIGDGWSDPPPFTVTSSLRTRSIRYSQHTILVSDLMMCNSLPSSVRNTSISVASFCGQLKTEMSIARLHSTLELVQYLSGANKNPQIALYSIKLVSKKFNSTWQSHMLTIFWHTVYNVKVSLFYCINISTRESLNVGFHNDGRGRVDTFVTNKKKHVDRVAQSFEVECHVLCISAVTITAVCTRGHILINLW